jgi:HD-GYP domain-containing protein (c-di-GMP phosphodiesterase class II)
LPCPRADFEQLAEALLDGVHEDHWRTVLEPDGSDLARLVRSQVIAEPVMAGGHVTGLLMAGNKVSDDPEVTSIETQLLDATADYLGAFLHNVALYDEQRDMFLGTVSALSAAIDAKDRYTRGHSERVAWLAGRLAIAAGMNEEQAERVRIAGIVHDVGKIGVPEVVLQKPGKLTEKEFDLIKQHPVIGHTILKDIAPLHDVLPGVLYHHERWQGGGYPEGIAGEEIPRLGRLLAVVDTFDAMSSARSYRPAIARDQVLSEIAACAGTQFDPEFAEAFRAVDLDGYDAMVDRAAAREREAA